VERSRIHRPLYAFLNRPSRVYGAKLRGDGCRSVFKIQCPRHIVLTDAKLLEAQNLVGIVSTLTSHSDDAATGSLIGPVPDPATRDQTLIDHSGLLHSYVGDMLERIATESHQATSSPSVKR
jgi:hypothetical protein